jgi:hypothetical protein
MEKWKTKSRFSTFPPPRFLIFLRKKTRTRAGSALRVGGRRFAPPKRQKVIVVDREK